MSAEVLQRFRRAQGGTTAVETAIIAPVFFLFMLGIIHLGWALHCGSSVRWALERSARAIVLNPDLTEAQLAADVRARLTSLVGERTISVTLVRQGSAPQLARATADYSHPLSIPFIPTRTLQFHAETVVPVLPS